MYICLTSDYGKESRWREMKQLQISLEYIVSEKGNERQSVHMF